MNDWFEWNGVRCTQYGIYVSELPPPTIPSERVTYTNAPGRPGSLTTLEGEDVYEDVVLTAQCFLSDPTKIPAIAAWLKGSGKVAFAHRQGGFYYARIANQISFEKILRGNPHRSFAVNFRSKPFWYQADVAPVTLTTSTSTIPTTTRLNGLRIDHGKVTVIPDEAKAVALIFELRRAGMGKNGIARELNRRGVPAKRGGIWHESVVETILRNEKYQGDLLLQKQYRVDHLSKIDRPNLGELPQYLVRDDHEAIVSREVFEEVQQSIRERATAFPKGHGVRARYPFSQRLICGHCGKHYKRRVNSGKIAWQCSTYMTRGKALCPAKQIRESILEAVSAEVLGTDTFDAGLFEREISHIRVCEGNRLAFIFRDGRKVEKTWKGPSRRDSWTDEMKEQAAEHAKRRNRK